MTSPVKRPKATQKKAKTGKSDRLHFSQHSLIEPFHQYTGNISRPSSANDSSIDLCDRQYSPTGAGNKGFTKTIDIQQGGRGQFNPKSFAPRNFKCDLP